MSVIYSKAYFNLLTATRTPIRADKWAVFLLMVSDNWRAYVPLRGRGLSPPG